MKKHLVLFTVVLAVSLIFTASSCSGGETTEDGRSVIPESGIILGTIELRVTDPPPADVKSAIVRLENIEVHPASGNSTDSDNNSGWITVLETPASFDLMDVLGIEQLLGSIDVAPGKYTQIRMDVVEVTGEMTDGTQYTAEVPGDKLRINKPFTVAQGSTTVLTLDFDGEKSLIRTGSGRFMFKPVVHLLVDGKQEMEQETEKEAGEDAGAVPENEMEQEKEKAKGR